jgi:uncharacterized membrane protein YeaQ/YmgE (transglycosylase-associated protein family)
VLGADSSIGILDIVWYVIAGLIIGLLARAILPGRQHMSIVASIVLGVVAAVIGGLVWNAVLPGNQGVAWIGSIVVAVILLWLYARFAPNLSRRRV